MLRSTPGVRLVRQRDRAEALPPVAPQRVEPAVVAGAGVGVGLDLAAGGQRLLGEDAQASDDVGQRAATFAGSSPAARASRGPGSSGSRTGGGPAIRSRMPEVMTAILRCDPTAEPSDRRPITARSQA